MDDLVTTEGRGDDEALIERCLAVDSDRFAVLCRMHLLLLLDLNLLDVHPQTTNKTKEKFSKLRFGGFVPNLKHKKDAFRCQTTKISLTKEFGSGLYELIEFLGHETNLRCEGLFRKSGKKSREQELRRSIFNGTELRLGSIDCPYNAHDCASVLKGVLADLNEPLLTEGHYDAHCQIADLCRETTSREEREKNQSRRIKSLQLIFLLLPTENRKLLRHLFYLLHRVSLEHAGNRMDAVNLATMFAPHILCPRKMSAEELRLKSHNLTGAVAFMIENAPDLFRVPSSLLTDLREFLKYSDERKSAQIDKDDEEEAVRTTITFCDRKCSNDVQSDETTAVALAELYSYVNSMPESAKKKQLLKQFKKENFRGTPSLKNHKRNRSLRKVLKTRLFGNNKANTQFYSGVNNPSKENCNSLSSETKADIVDGCDEEVEDEDEIARGPTFLSNSTSLVTLRAAVASRQDSDVGSSTSDQQGCVGRISNERYMLGQMRMPSSSSLVFHSRSYQSYSNRSSNMTSGHLCTDLNEAGLRFSRSKRPPLIFRETAL